MRKDIALPVLALAGGGACLALRRWQLAAALDPETELFRSVPATPVLIGVLALLALGGTVAAVSKEPFRWTDTYVLDITDPKDALYVLMFVLAIDAEKCSRN